MWSPKKNRMIDNSIYNKTHVSSIGVYLYIGLTKTMKSIKIDLHFVPSTGHVLANKINAMLYLHTSKHNTFYSTMLIAMIANLCARAHKNETIFVRRSARSFKNWSTTAIWHRTVWAVRPNTSLVLEILPPHKSAPKIQQKIPNPNTPHLFLTIWVIVSLQCLRQFLSV